MANTAAERGIPVPAFTSALSYFDSYRRHRLPASLLQAQRDHFGAHTYERVEPRAVKRRRKPHDLLSQPRAQVLAKLLAGGAP